MARSVSAILLMILMLGIAWAPEAESRQREIKQGFDVEASKTAEGRTIRAPRVRRAKLKRVVPEKVDRSARAESRRQAKVLYFGERPREIYTPVLHTGKDPRDRRPAYRAYSGRNFSHKMLRKSKSLHGKLSERDPVED